MPKIIDLTGQYFGRWKVLYRAGTKNGQALWHCQCQCEKHTEKDIRGGPLRYGKSLSCGCLNSERMTKYNKENFVDISNEIFGEWKVLHRSNEKAANGEYYWICQCSCGTIRAIRISSLLNGQSMSCGCKKFSKGENLVSCLLKENKISFETQKTFNNCKYPLTNYQAKFDFFVENKYLIEFDGAQHFHSIEYFGGDDRYQDQKEKDQFKNQWCKDNNIPLIRIPYWHLKDLCIEDLKLETSQFII